MQPADSSNIYLYMRIIVVHIDHQRLAGLLRGVHHLNNTFDAPLAHAGNIMPKGLKEPCNQTQRHWETKRNVFWSVSGLGITAIHIHIYPARRASASAQRDQQNAQHQWQNHAIKPKINSRILLDGVNDPRAEHSKEDSDPQRD